MIKVKNICTTALLTLALTCSLFSPAVAEERGEVDASVVSEITEDMDVSGVEDSQGDDISAIEETSGIEMPSVEETPANEAPDTPTGDISENGKETPESTDAPLEAPYEDVDIPNENTNDAVTDEETRADSTAAEVIEEPEVSEETGTSDPENTDNRQDSEATQDSNEDPDDVSTTEDLTEGSEEQAPQEETLVPIVVEPYEDEDLAAFLKASETTYSSKTISELVQDGTLSDLNDGQVARPYYIYGPAYDLCNYYVSGFVTSYGGQLYYTYCLQPEAFAPIKTTSSEFTDDSADSFLSGSDQATADLLKKVLYYGNPDATDRYYGLVHPEYSFEERLIITHITAAAAGGFSAENKWFNTTAKGQAAGEELLAYAEAAPLPEEQTLTFTPSDVYAYFTKDGLQRTDNVTITGNPAKSYTFTLPEGVNLVNVTDGTESGKGGTITLDSGDTFYLTGELEQVSKTGEILTLTQKLAVPGEMKVIRTVEKTNELASEYTYQIRGFLLETGDSYKDVTLTVHWKTPTGKISVQKKDAKTDSAIAVSGGTLAGAEYTIYGDEALGTAVATMTTDENGQATSDELPLGTYYIKETKRPVGYLLDETVYPVALDKPSDIAVSFESKEAPIQGRIRVQKKDKETGETMPQNGGSFAGAEYTIYSDSACTNVVQIISTDENGSAISGSLPLGTYYVKETRRPEGYELDSEIHTVTLMDDLATETITALVESPEEPQKKRIRVQKKDALTEDGSASTHLSLAGAVYSIYKDEALSDKAIDITTDENGIAESGDLPLGTYYVKETTSPSGYNPDETVYMVTLKDEAIGEVDTNTTVTVESAEQPVRIEIGKKDITADEELPGATLTIRDENGNEVESWVSTTEPHTISLPEGKYTLTEVAAPSGYATAETIEFTVTKTLDVQHVEMEDKPLEAEISKTDITTGEELPGATLQVKDSDGNLIEEWVSTDTPHKINLPQGTYTLTEVTAPDGYTTAETITFTIKDTREIQRVEMKDSPNYTLISKTDITTGKELPGATLQVKDKSGNLIEEWVSTTEPHKIYLPDGDYTLTEISAPSGYSTAETIEFTVQDEKTVKTVTMQDKPLTVEISKKDVTNGEELPGATLQVKDEKGNLIEEWVSTDTPHTINLSTGKYTLTEITAPKGYATAETIEFEVKDTTVVQHVEMEDKPIEVEISKTDITTGEELPGATLQVKDNNGNLIEEWVSTDTPHKINLPTGKYKLTEITAPKGYATAETIEFTVKDSTVVQHVEMQDKPLEVEISKVDIAGNELPGATLQVRDKNGNLIEEWVSTTESHKIRLPQGEYTLTEITAPKGYATAETITFTVTDTMEVQYVEMEDKPLEVEISKADITTGEELPGATLQVRDEDGNLIEEWISTEEPHKINLPTGKYTLTEITAPDGYATAETITFTVTDTMEVQHVEMQDKPLTVEISKQDITTKEELPGATLQVKDEDDNLIEEWVSTDTPHKINLKKGKYTLTEITAPNGYAVAETITFEVKDTLEVQKVEMLDQPLVTTPTVQTQETITSTPTTTTTAVKTGDVFRYLPAILAGAAGILLLLFFVLTGRKKVRR